MPAAGLNFEQVLASVGTNRFLSEYWTKKLLYLKGEKGRFERIFSWPDLNTILTWHPPPQPQLRLFQEGIMVDLRRYIDGPVGNLRLSPGGLMALLAQGATMVMDGVQEVSPSVFDLTSSFEDVLSCACVANLYAGWRTQKGFNVHWDPQSPAVRASAHAVMEIEEQGITKPVELNGGQLQAGLLIYRYATNAVRFKLTVYPKATTSVSESVEWRR